MLSRCAAGQLQARNIPQLEGAGEVRRTAPPSGGGGVLNAAV
jgi:hypothetical protein